MKIKERIINQSIKKAKERIAFLKHELFDNDPIKAQFDIHCKFAKFLEEKKGKERTTKESIEHVNELNKEMDLHKKRTETYNIEELMKELVCVESELKDLMNEQYYLERTKKGKK